MTREATTSVGYALGTGGNVKGAGGDAVENGWTGMQGTGKDKSNVN